MSELRDATQRLRRPHRPSRSKRVKRRIGALTSAVRVLPDTLIVGAQRCGTSSLYRYLERHPRVLTGLRKEVRYFHGGMDEGRGVDWYRGHFPTALTVGARGLFFGRRPRVIESTPIYLYQAGSHARMHALLPDARLVVLLRHPVERAHSQYRLGGVRRARRPSFEECVESGIARASRVPTDLEFFEKAPVFPDDMVARGLYAGQLESLFRYYSREQVLVVRSEDFYSDTDAVFQHVLGFLDLPPCRLRSYPTRNAQPGAVMASGARKRLEDFYRPHNDRLYALLGRDFGWS